MTAVPGLRHHSDVTPLLWTDVGTVKVDESANRMLKFEEEIVAVVASAGARTFPR